MRKKLSYDRRSNYLNKPATKIYSKSYNYTWAQQFPHEYNQFELEHWFPFWCQQSFLDYIPLSSCFPLLSQQYAGDHVIETSTKDKPQQGSQSKLGEADITIFQQKHNYGKKTTFHLFLDCFSAFKRRPRLNCTRNSIGSSSFWIKTVTSEPEKIMKLLKHFDKKLYLKRCTAGKRFEK